MQLTQFIQDIIQQGKVTVDGQVTPFGDEDIEAATQRLREHYELQKQELTATVPPFVIQKMVWLQYFRAQNETNWELWKTMEK